MTAKQRIKREILLRCREASDGEDAHLFPFRPEDLETPAGIDLAWRSTEDCDDVSDWLQETAREFRYGNYETDIGPDYSRHYSSKSVAARLRDGTYVGWTFWYGGGKHGEPEAMPWMEDAYLLEMKEEEKMVVVRTWLRRTEEDSK
jgi:hypothetical protein